MGSEMCIRDRSLGDVRRSLDENTTLIGTRAQLILEIFAARAER